MQYCSKNALRIPLFLLLSALLALTACSGVTPRSGTPVQPKVEEPKRPMAVSLVDVEAAYKSGDMILAEKLATEFTNRSNIPTQQLGRGWRVLALSSLANGRARVTITALDRWRHSIDGVDTTEEWHNAWYKTLTLIPFNEALKRAEAVIAAESTRPPALVREAKLFILEQRFAQGNAGASIPGLEALYENAESLADKRQMEQRLWGVLHTASPVALTRLMSRTSDENESRFPYALIRLENARRMFWDLKKQGTARENVTFTREGSQLSDKSLFRIWNEPDYNALDNVHVKNQAIALVLPLSGPYGNLAEKIVRGAEVVRNGLESHGQNLRIYVIDSDQPNWLSDLSNLPRSVRIVGGPLRLEEYSAIKSMGYSGRRFFFSFLPRMDNHDEGVTAWRFFPSREDQVRVMLDYSKKLGATNLAIFTPDRGDYSQSMFDMFYYQAAERNLYVTRAGYYPDKQYQLWVKSVADFLGYSKGENPSPRLEFQAMFLPDNWSNSSRIISHIFYAMENKILFMGTNLWEHGLAGQQRLATRNYRLAIFPGSWDMQSLTPSGQLVRTSAALGGKFSADFWVSLGFDFALAAASLNLPENAKADDVNAALASLPPLPWSGAPISWDKQGFAQQDLLVLTPAEYGFVIADPERIKRLMNSTGSGGSSSGNSNGTPAGGEVEE